MNSPDNSTRATPPSMLSDRGQGIHIKFMCDQCSKPKSQAGSKILKVRGFKRRICSDCDKG